MNAKPRFIPFRVGGPIQDPADFAGRREILRVMSNAMLNLQNVSLHGERRTGKTSLLLYLAHPTTSSIIGLPETHIPVYFNFQDFSEARAANVWQAMADSIAEQIKQRYPDGQAESERFLATIAEFLNTPEAPELFGTGFGRAFAHLDGSDFKFHLLFDEFDQTIRNPNLGDLFYDALRSLPTRAENISYVIATRTGLTALQPIYNKISSPLFNIFTQVILGPFQEDEVYRLIFDYFARAELDISLAEKLCAESTYLYEVTGYHPFFLQMLCYHLYARLDEPDWPLGRARHVALEAFEKDAKPHFEYYWEVSPKKEQGLIKRLAAKQSIDWDQLETKALVENLKDRCLVVRADERKGEWRLFSSVLSRWVQTEFPVEIPPLPLLVTFFFNLVILAGLTIMFGHEIPSGCISSTGVGLSLGLVTLALFHLTWRYLGETLLNLVIPIGSFFKIPMGRFGALFEQLHPRALSDYILWTQALIFFMIAGLLWFPVLSPFRTSEPVPNIQNFLVHYADGHIENYDPGNSLSIAKDTRVVIEAKTLDSPDISCTWFAIDGKVHPVGRCATQYNAPVERDKDTLTVLLQSPCRTYQTFASLFIEIVQVGH